MTRLNEVLNYKSIYEDKGVLKNKLGITNQLELDKAERKITAYKIANLYLIPRYKTFDVEHYLDIHKYLFEDIYEFAGEIRSESITKTISFCLPNLIYNNLKDTLDKANRDYLKIKNEEDLVNFITYFYAELDIIHPFREGNGRVEREFLREYVERINENISFGKYYLDYDLIENKNEFVKSVIIADARCDLSYLKEFIRTILVNEMEKKHVR